MIPFTVSKKAGKDRFHFITVLFYSEMEHKFFCKQGKKLFWMYSTELTESTEFEYFVEKKEKENN